MVVKSTEEHHRQLVPLKDNPPPLTLDFEGVSPGSRLEEFLSENSCVEFSTIDKTQELKKNLPDKEPQLESSRLD